MTSAVLNVSNKFGFLNISDSEDEGGWQKPKKSAASGAKKGGAGAQKKKMKAPGGNVVGMASSQNIIAPPAGGQGMSKNAKRRANKKKKQAEEDAALEAEVEVVAEPTEEEIFQRQLEEAMQLSSQPNATKPNSKAAVNGHSKAPTKSKPAAAAVPDTPEEDEEEEEEDLFLPVIEDIKSVIRNISRDDEIPITEIPLDNGTLYVKRALELQEINTEFKSKLNSMLRVGYRYRKRYLREKHMNSQLRKVIDKCESSKKTDMAKKIVELEETEQALMKQIEEMTEEVEKEKTKSRSTNSTSDKKAVKKVSFSES